MGTIEAKRMEMRIRVLAANGISVADHTPEEWLKLALEAEQAKCDCGPFDPAFEWFCAQERRFTEAAELAEAMSAIQ